MTRVTQLLVILSTMLSAVSAAAFNDQDIKPQGLLRSPTVCHVRAKDEYALGKLTNQLSFAIKVGDQLEIARLAGKRADLLADMESFRNTILNSRR